MTEGALRAEGHAKTPDIKLELPIAVNGRIVNWIDSKASFCDPLVHVERGADQFQGYVNRFGPGMVVYWFGVIDELAEESGGRTSSWWRFPGGGGHHQTRDVLRTRAREIDHRADA